MKASARWRNLQIADPLNSRIAILLATALEASGDRAAAVRHVEAHNAVLAAELGIGPVPALSALGERLRSSPAVTAASAKPARRTEPPPQADEADRDAPVPHEVRRRDPTGAVPGELPAKPAPIRSRRGGRMAMVVLVLVAVGVALGAAVLSRRPPGSGRERVTVGIFENRTGDTALAPLGRMAAFDRALLEAFRADLAGDLHAGVRAMRTVAAMAPESQFVVGYAVMAIAANRPREALAALRGVDPDVGLLRDNPGYWEWLTVSLHLLGDHGRALREARTARELFPGLHGPLVQELRALAALGRTGDVARLIEASRTLPAQSSGTTADAVVVAAAELRAHGDREAAARLLDQAIEWYRDRPVEEQPGLRLTVARMFYESGRWDEARAAFETLAAERPGMVAY